MLAAHLAQIGYSITFHGWPVFFDAKYYRVKEKVLSARFTRAISYFCRSQLMMFSEQDDPRTFKVVHCGLSLDRYHYRPPREPVRRIFCAARLSPAEGTCFSHSCDEISDRSRITSWNFAWLETVQESSS